MFVLLIMVLHVILNSQEEGVPVLVYILCPHSMGSYIPTN